jgi:HSP20 family protein
MATLGRWRGSGSEIDPLRRQMTRLVEDFFGDTGNLLAEAEIFRPNVEVRETDDRYEVICDLPGINPDEAEISVHQNVLTIRGERKEQREEKGDGGRRIYSETFYGAFMRTIALPGEIKRDDITASYKDGQLRILLPKAEAAKPKSIQIERRD